MRKPTSSETEREYLETVKQRIGEALSSACGKPWNIIRTETARLRRSTLEMISVDPTIRSRTRICLEIEAQRRFAELQLLLALLKRRPFSTCKRLFEALRELGFSNLATQYDWTLQFAKECGRFERPLTGIRRLKELLHVLR